MTDGIDLTAELDAAEDIVMGRVEAVITKWGCRYDDGCVQRARDEETARKIVRAGKDLGHVLVSRKVTIGPWEEVPGD